MRDKEIIHFSATHLAYLIASRELSCFEVMCAYLDQIEAINPEVNAIISMLDREQLELLAQVKDQEIGRYDVLPPLYGLPLAPKDLTATHGIVTSLGSPIFKDQRNAVDSIVVERMRRAGGILIGKTNVPEFGLGSHTYNTVFGSTKNAYDQSKSAGGSSGGAAVALALEMLPIADGSDFGGSLRNPAAWNNIYGFRPSRGRVPQGPSLEVFYDQFSTEGPMAKNVQDLILLLSIQAGYDERAPLSLKTPEGFFNQNLQTDLRGKKIAWLKDLDSYLPMQDGVINLCESGLGYFTQLGCEVELVVPQFNMASLWRAWSVLRAFVTGSKLHAFYQNPLHRSQMKPEAIWEVEESMKLNALDIYQASQIRTGWVKETNRLFTKYDFLVLPSAQLFPFDIRWTWPKEIAHQTMDTYHRWMEVVIGPTLAGLPVLAAPVGFHQGVPMGIQIIGKPQGDLELLQMGFAWEQVVPFHETRPALLRGL